MGKNPPLPLGRRLSGAQSQSGVLEKIKIFSRSVWNITRTPHTAKHSRYWYFEPKFVFKNQKCKLHHANSWWMMQVAYVCSFCKLILENFKIEFLCHIPWLKYCVLLFRESTLITWQFPLQFYEVHDLCPSQCYHICVLWVRLWYCCNRRSVILQYFTLTKQFLFNLS